MSGATRIALSAAVLAGFAALSIGCSDYAGLTDIEPPTEEEVVDSLPPVISLSTPTGTLEAGDSLTATITDDSEVTHAQAIVMDSARAVVWVSDTVPLHGDSLVSIPLVDLPASFPYGETLQFTMWARDAGERERFAGTDDADLMNLDGAETVEFTVGFGRTYSIGEGHSFGGMVYDEVDRRAYLTVTDMNQVRGFDLDDAEFVDWKVSVGSEPDLIAFQRYAWGYKPTLAVFNAGGTDVSLVDLALDGRSASERWRIRIPLMKVDVAGEAVSLSPNASSILLHCPEPFCHHPILYIASPSSDGSDPVALRALPLTELAPPPDSFAIFAPTYVSGVPEEDEQTDVQAWVVDAQTGEENSVFGPVAASKCGTLAFGGARITAAKKKQGSLFIAEQGESGGACGEGSRALRFDIGDGGRYQVHPPSVVHHDFDAAIDGIEEIQTNDDASTVLLRSGTTILVTDGDLRRLGRVEVEGAEAMAVLDEQEGDPGFGSDGRLFAVSSSEGIAVYEDKHFTLLRMYPTGQTPALSFRFVRTRDGVAFIGITADQSAVFFFETTLEAIRSGSSGS